MDLQVADRARPKPELKKDWSLNQAALSQLLQWLDEGPDSGGEKYLEMRQRLVGYFDRKNCLHPDDLADETLNRVARRLQEEGAITDTPPARYCYIVAKFVFMEYLRRSERDHLPIEDSESPRTSADVNEGEMQSQLKEKLLVCLEQCLQTLEHDNRDLIFRYYHGERRTKIDNRRGLADRLGVTVNALSIRACRIRSKLEVCVGKCCEK